MATLKQIEAAHWVNKLASFHAAAERLGTTQSTVSKRIQDLEQSLGFAIFDRSSKMIQVTLKGRGLMDDFAAMLNLHRRIEHVARGDSSYSGYVHIGATEMVALTWLPALIKAITARFPHINLRTSIGLTRDLQEKLADYKLDLLLCPVTHNEALAGLESVQLPALESAWMCSPEMAADRRGVLSAEEIVGLPLLTFAEGSLLHQTVVRTLSEHGYTARQTITCSSMIALAELVREGLGVAYLPRDYFQSYGGGLSILHTNMAMRPLQYAAIHRDDFISAQISELARQLCSFQRPGA